MSSIAFGQFGRSRFHDPIDERKYATDACLSRGFFIHLRKDASALYSNESIRKWYCTANELIDSMLGEMRSTESDRRVESKSIDFDGTVSFARNRHFTKLNATRFMSVGNSISIEQRKRERRRRKRTERKRETKLFNYNFYFKTDVISICSV